MYMRKRMLHDMANEEKLKQNEYDNEQVITIPNN